MYILIELQTDIDGNTANIVTGYKDRAEAESAYYAKLSFAVTSTVPRHAVTLLDDDAAQMFRGVYNHDISEQ